MKIASSNYFKVPVPAGWESDRDGNRIALFLPEEEGILELIPSGVSGPDPSGDLIALVFRTMLSQMRRAAADPNLKPATEETVELRNGLCHTSFSVTKEGDFFLAQFCLKGPAAVVLAEYQGPIGEQKHLPAVRGIVESIEWLERPGPSREEE